MDSGVWDFFIFMMAIWFPIFIIVFIKHYLNYRKHVAQEMAKLKQNIDIHDTVELKKQLQQMQERIATLESIVTDKQYTLNEKISNLR